MKNIFKVKFRNLDQVLFFLYSDRDFLNQGVTMKKVNKLLAAGAVLAFAVMGSVFAEGDFTFENELSTNTYRFGNGYDDNNRFPFISERMQVEYESEKFDVNADFSLEITGYNEDTLDGKKTIISLDGPYGNDSFVKFRPIDALQLSIAYYWGAEKAAGSYLPVSESYSSYNPFGRYTGNFGLLFKPMEGLSIGAGIDTGYLFQDYYNNRNKNLTLNFGAEYEADNIGSFAVTFNDVANHFAFGAFAKISAVQAMDIYAGLAYQKDRNENFYSINGKLFFNAGLELKNTEKFSLAAELVTNFFTEADYTDDLYAGLRVGYDVNENFNIGAKTRMWVDFVDSNTTEDYDPRNKPYFSIVPELTYKLGNNTFKAGFSMAFRGDNFWGTIPLSWSYSF